MAILVVQEVDGIVAMNNQETGTLYSGEGYVLGGWQVWPDYGVLINDGHEVHVEPKVMAVLLCLIRAEGRVVSREALLESVWADVVVNEEVLTRAVSELRTLLGDVGRPRRYVATIPRKGYRLLVKAPPVEKVRQLGAGDSNGSSVRFSLPLPAGCRMVGRMVHRTVAVTGYIMVALLLLALLNPADKEADYQSEPMADTGRTTLLHVELIQPALLVGWLRQALAY